MPDGEPPGYFENRGKYFSKKRYHPAPLPKFAETRHKLPSPVFDEQPLLIDLYWKAWEIAFRNFHEPAPDSGFVSQFVDAAFNQNIFLWDTCFLTMFCNYGGPHVPSISSLDNFYCKQFENGEICREIDRATGREYREWINRDGEGLRSRWGTCAGDKKPFTVRYVDRDPPKPPPNLTLDALNHPIPAWAELESFRITADRDRLGLVFEPLERYYRALQTYLRQGSGLYMTDWASMDNSARNVHLDGGGAAVDTSSQMALFACCLSRMAEALGRGAEAAMYRREAAELADLINARMWDPERKFYFDLTVSGERTPIKTCAAFWTMLAGVAGPEQARALSDELRNPATFGRPHRVPTLSRGEKEYDPSGGYWLGAVWAPIDTMVIRGLERRCETELAREIAMEHLQAVAKVFKETGTIWENYAPDAAKPGTPAKADFVGWSGIGPIMFLIEYAIGIRVDAPGRAITWEIRSSRRLGVERLPFGGKTVSLVCEEPDAEGRRTARVTGEASFRLKLVHGGAVREVDFAAGTGPAELTLPFAE